jgi:hypothetical protein
MTDAFYLKNKVLMIFIKKNYFIKNVGMSTFVKQGTLIWVKPLI